MRAPTLMYIVALLSVMRRRCRGSRWQTERTLDRRVRDRLACRLPGSSNGIGCATRVWSSAVVTGTSRDAPHGSTTERGPPGRGADPNAEIGPLADKPAGARRSRGRKPPESDAGDFSLAPVEATLGHRAGDRRPIERFIR